MSQRSAHYPTMIENEKTGERVQVNSDWEHHKKLLLWKEPGLEPVPIAPPESREAQAARAAKREPDYPRMLENPKTGERVEVANSGSEELVCKNWHVTIEDARRAAQGLAPVPKTQAAPPAKPATPAKPAAAKSTAKPATPAKPAAAAASTSTGPKLPPTVAQLKALGYVDSMAKRMAAEEQKKFDAGEEPYTD